MPYRTEAKILSLSKITKKQASFKEFLQKTKGLLCGFYIFLKENTADETSCVPDYEVYSDQLSERKGLAGLPDVLKREAWDQLCIP